MLSTFLQKLPDKRRRQGQMYDMGHLLLFSVLAILSGAGSYRKIHTFIKSKMKILKKTFKLKWKKAPAYSTIRRVIQAVDSDELEKAFRLHSGTLAKKPENELMCISMDGKAVRGSFDHFEDQKAVQVLSAFLLKEDIILAHAEIEEKTNEIPVVQKLIKELGLKDCLFVTDALHCQKKH